MTKLFIALTAAALFLAFSCATKTGPQANAGNAVEPVPAVTPATRPTVVSPVTDSVPRITLAEAKKDFDEGTAVFIDTHSKEQFAAQHIKGAINISYTDIAANLNKIPKGKKIIAYCS